MRTHLSEVKVANYFYQCFSTYFLYFINFLIFYFSKTLYVEDQQELLTTI
jgi:hypothetical protein